MPGLKAVEHTSASSPVATGREERAEHATRWTEELLKATIESTADGILVVDNNGNALYANQRFARMWRIPQELLETRDDNRLLAFVVDQLKEPEEFLRRVKELYRSSREDLYKLEFKDGRVFERYSRPLMDEDAVVGRVWSFRDITQRTHADDRLREAEAKYRSLVEQIPAVTYIDAAKGPATTLYISPQTESMFGYTQQEWLSDPELLSKQIHPDDRPRWRAENDRCDSTGDPFSLEYRIRTRDGRLVWVRDESVLVRDADGRPQFWQGVMFDITERKQVEERLEQAWQREIDAGQRLRALDEMKNTFLQAVSHELRTPLTAILGAALTLEREELELAPEVSRELLASLAENARKLNRLLSDLLDLDRLSRGILEPKREPTDLHELVTGLIDELDLGDHPLEIDVEPIVIAVDPAKVERIVENLLVNVVRHTGPGTPVWVRVEREPRGALITVEDAGPGVREDMRKTVFESFRQGPGTRPYSPGVGIGLALVASFAELHGGRAWVEEREGGGASFRVLLPDEPSADG
jgi:PAS domain S-box-containing protein